MTIPPTQTASGAERLARRVDLVRESLISALINAVLSLFFFLLASQFRASVGWGVLGGDFPIQSFMVALMGSLVPGLIHGRGAGVPVRRVLTRSVMAAVLAALLGIALAAACRAPQGELALGSALAIKALYGAALGVVATQVQLRALLANASE